MNKQEILQSLESGLHYALCKMLECSEEKPIGLAIKCFILEDASRYEPDELLERFSTMEKGLAHFLEYLESEKMPDKITIH